ncbi:TetR/AcrR family transcriptional regulator [Tomitella biformata]|uniref:TetR/AcrR family transcriptional regulator n=1 Tax=Tomitella biformata TaxID=630403 RepID=UPI000463B253|nr:TetR/AcrR family transcriptional regulator [Tomitella biformata]
MSVAPEVRKEGPRSKRASILTAAIEQFGEVGYEHTKWASIAGEVGIGQTALYHYFESKAHCLLTIMQLELTDSAARFTTGTEGIADSEEMLRSAVAASLHGSPIDALQRRILQNHMDILASPRQSEKEEAERLHSRELVAEIERNWTNLLKSGMDDGTFNADIDPRVSARLVLGVLVSVWRWYRPGGPMPLDELIDSVSDAVVRMVRA